MATQSQITEEVKTNQPEIDKDTGKFVHIYQPRDSEGQFIGRPYRFLYTDHMDLVQQIERAKEEGDRYIHEVKTGKRKVVGDPATPVPTYQPAAESTEEAEKKRREEFRKTYEQEFGTTVEDGRERLKRQRMIEEGLEAQNWALANEGNGYYICKENARAIIAWLDDETKHDGKKLAHKAANYDLAFEALKDTLVQAPKEQAPPADSTQQQATTSTRTDARPQSTGIIPGQFGGTRPQAAADKQPLTRDRFRQIDKMSRDQWKKLERANPTEAKAFLAMKYPAQPQQ